MVHLANLSWPAVAGALAAGLGAVAFTDARKKTRLVVMIGGVARQLRDPPVIYYGFSSWLAGCRIQLRLAGVKSFGYVGSEHS